MTYKFLILDIDGTLLNSQSQITPQTKEKLIAFQQVGYKLVLASGRPTASMIHTARALQLDVFDSYIISFNGAVITRMRDLSELYSKRLDVIEQSEIIHFIQSQNLSVIGYDEDGIIIDVERENSQIESELTKLPMRYDADYFKQLAMPQLKLIGVGKVDAVSQADALLKGTFGKTTYATTSLPFFLEFMHKDVSKGNAIRFLVDHLGHTTADVVAVGDGNNDAAMIEVAGLGVAMGNATPLLKELADVITLTNDEDGLIPIIEKYFKA